MSNQITTVVVDGPFPNANKWSDWEEYPEWTVSTADDDGNDIGRISYFRSLRSAEVHAAKLAGEHGLELVNEASPYF